MAQVLSTPFGAGLAITVDADPTITPCAGIPRGSVIVFDDGTGVPRCYHKHDDADSDADNTIRFVMASGGGGVQVEFFNVGDPSVSADAPGEASFGGQVIVDGNVTILLAPTAPTAAGASLTVNPVGATAGAYLLYLGVGGVDSMTVDEAGNAVIGVLGSGSLSVPGAGVSSEQFGLGASAAGAFTTVIGVSATGAGERAVVIGKGASAPDRGAIVLGYLAASTGTWGIAIGESVTAAAWTVSIGATSDAMTTGSIAIGRTAQAGTANYNIAIGTSANAQGTVGGVAIGYNAQATTGASPFALGYSSIATGNYSLALGYNAVASGAGAVAIGYHTDATVAFGFAMGYNAQATGGSYATALGYSANASAAAAFALGAFATSAYAGIALGYHADTTAAGQFVVGASESPITAMYIGEGVTSPEPSDFTLNATGGSGTDIAAGEFIVAVGRSTGAGDPGRLIFKTTAVEASSATLQALRTALVLDDLNAEFKGTASIASKLTVFGEIELNSTLNHDGANIGFYGTAPIGKQIGVAVTAAAVHAALVNLGLIAA